ncbi:hypothetical protein BDQ17DRAFT_1435626 [Cyathus striatus]|nr:hypothetical protein BDQ17DRAFT_1435626 [Cyathus striatus]
MQSTLSQFSPRRNKSHILSQPIFPPEILLQFLQFTTCPKTLYSLLQTSIIFRTDAEKKLYAGVFINYDEWSKENHRQFLSTISSVPRLAALVQVYSAGDFSKDAKSTHLLRTAFEAMSNLEELTFRNIRRSITTPIDIFDKCTFLLK